MRKMLSAALLMCIVALLSTTLTPVYATPPITASGTWTYTPTPIDIRYADGNQFVYGEEDSVWAGTFSGTSYDVFTVIKHKKIWNVEGLIDFEGTVDGKLGTLVILFVGKLTPPPGEWSGKWAILSGTGELENLRGQGTWGGPPLNPDYSGKIHFEPN